MAGLRAEGEAVISSRVERAYKLQAYLKAIEDAKFAVLRAEGEQVIASRTESARKLQAYLNGQRLMAILGDWADADGMLCRLKADGKVEMPPSRGGGGTWKAVETGGFDVKIEITLALAQTTRNGVPAGNREHTLRGGIAFGLMTGSVETTMFGSVASGDLELTKM